VAAYTKALELSPDHVDSLFNRGAAYEIMGQNDEALRDYITASGLSPFTIDVWRARADLEYAQHMMDSCLESYRRVVDLDPKSAQSWYEYADTLFEARRYAEAWEAVRETITIDEQWDGAQVLLAKILYKMGRDEDSISVLKRLHDRQPHEFRRLRLDEPMLAAFYDRYVQETT
jgi:tetratricopeptide (TPR) repeat protein